MTKKTAAERILAGMDEALRHSRGKEVKGLRTQVVSIPVIDVRKIRMALKLSQASFAARFGFSAAVVRNWEQGRNQPDGAARVLLAVIAKYPGVVEEAICDMARLSG